MSVQPPPPVTWKDWLPVISLAFVVLGAVMWFGGYVSQGEETARRTAVLEQREDRRDQDRAADKDKLNTIDVRTARIESKLEVLLPAKDHGQ